MTAWPTSLPSFLLEQYKETDGTGIIRSSMDSGPAKIRRRFTKVPKYLQGNIGPLTSTQVETLRTFYYTTCVGGTSTFTWVHPRTNAAITVRWSGTTFPEITNVSGSILYMANIQLEIVS